MKTKQCDLCNTLVKDSDDIGIWGRGIKGSDFMIVDSVPYPEDWATSPFKGAHFKFLKKYISKATGLDPAPP